MTAPVVIVGAGPAGMAATVTLARHGVRSVIVDEAPRVGGVVYRGPLREGVSLDYLGARYRKRMQALHAEFGASSDFVDVRLGRRVIGGHAGRDGHGHLQAWSRSNDCIEHLAFSQALLSPGCHERSVPFPGWTLPGVMLLGGMQLQIKSFVTRPMGSTVLVGTGPLLPLVACQLVRAGCKVEGIFESSPFHRMARQVRALMQQPQTMLDGMTMLAYLRMRGVPLHYGWGIVDAQGDASLSAVRVAPYDLQWRADLTKAVTIEAASLGVGYGFIPRTQITQQFGLDHGYDGLGVFRPVVDDWQRSSQSAVHVAGDAGGLRGGDAALLSGRIAALSILCQRGVLSDEEASAMRAPMLHKMKAIGQFREGINDFTRRGAGQLSLAQADTIICRCENVTRGDVDRAIDQGVTDLVSLKMRTRAGMGDCQGKMCVGYCSDRLRMHSGKQDVGWIRPRFPQDPVPFSAFASPVGKGAVA